MKAIIKRSRSIFSNKKYHHLLKYKREGDQEKKPKCHHRSVDNV